MIDYAKTTLIYITSMFVERMEVEYRLKFEVKLSTFPDFTYTETPRKLVLLPCPMEVLVSCKKSSLR